MTAREPRLPMLGRSPALHEREHGDADRGRAGRPRCRARSTRTPRRERAAAAGRIAHGGRLPHPRAAGRRTEARWRRDVRRRAQAALGAPHPRRRAQSHSARHALPPRRARRSGSCSSIRGAGNKENAKFHDIYGIENAGANGRTALEDALARARRTRRTTSRIVIDTHLHFDHGGGNTYRDEAGEVRPTFPNARYVVQRGEFDYATHTNERTAASYFAAQLRAGRRGGAVRSGGGRAGDRAGHSRGADAGPRPVPSGDPARVEGRARVLSGRPGADARAPAAPLDHGLRRGAARDARDEAADRSRGR